MHIITLSGKARNGKDAFARLLTQVIPNSHCYAFADEVKCIAKSAYDWNGIKDERGRKLLQDVGTAGRNYKPTIWVDRTIKNIQSGYPEVAIVTDARYANEINMIKQAFDSVTTVRIERFGYDNGLTQEQKAHPSETELDTYEFDYIIHNNSTVDAMRNEAEYIAKKVLGE